MSDAKQQFLETWLINDRINIYLLEAIDPCLMVTKLAKGKAVDSQFAHIHNVRLMWLKASGPDLYDSLTKLEGPNLEASLIAKSLGDSGKAVHELLARSWDGGGKVKNFKPHLTAFLAYLIAHESNHRAQIEVTLRQAGHALSDKIAYGLWEWGTR